MNFRLTATALWLIFLLISTHNAQGQPPAEWLKDEIKKHCAVYDVEPAFAAAVMKVESGFRCGPLGKKARYYGPGGIHKGFLKTWRIDLPEENIRITVMSLRNTRSTAAKLKRLKRYNTACTPAYLKAVMGQYQEYKVRKEF